MMIAFKIYADCPAEDRPAGVGLGVPWLEQVVDAAMAVELQGCGYRVMPAEQYALYKLATSPQAYVESVITGAVTFGAQLIREFAATNVLLGITADNMTGAVLTTLAPIVGALNTGSLAEVIARSKAIDPASYDGKYITAARILGFVNKIEAYLGYPLSETL